MFRKTANYYEEVGRELAETYNNLVLIEADENGRIQWQEHLITPNAFIETFLSMRGYPTEKNIEDAGFVVDGSITSRIHDECYEEIDDPLRQIELRKTGLKAEDFLGVDELRYCRHIETGKTGYLLALSIYQVHDLLPRTGVEYQLVGRL